MIIAQMMGNLGNQLFIYAMARTLQLQYGDDIVFDLQGLKRYYYSATYRLDSLNLPKIGISTNMDDVNLLSRMYYQVTSRLYHVEQKIYRALRKDSLIPNSVAKKWFDRGCYYNFSRAFYDYPVCKEKNKYVYGYFQSQRYFDQFEEQIRNDCQVVVPQDEYDKQLLLEICNCNAVAVSVRAINELGVSFIDFDYYYRAMEVVAKQIVNPVFYVFSDDLEVVKNQMKFSYPVVYVTPQDSCHGLRLMYNCKHFVIANSTFSWWGAYLSNYKDKVVVMPDKIDKGGYGREDYYLKNSIRIPCSFVDYKVDMDQIIHQKYAR